jgi:hypothetical protein
MPRRLIQFPDLLDGMFFLPHPKGEGTPVRVRAPQSVGTMNQALKPVRIPR